MEGTISKLDRAMDKLVNDHDQLVNIWYHEVLFTWRWWLGISVSVFMWVIWSIFHKKESGLRLFTAGFFVIGIALFLDAFGVQIGWWSYRYEVIPFIPAYLPYDLALLPVITMLLLQIKPNFNPYIKGIFFSLLATFVGEPIYIWLKIYRPIHWNHLYSLPIYFLIFIIAYWITRSDKYFKIE